RLFVSCVDGRDTARTPFDMTLNLVFVPGLLCDERLWRDQRSELSPNAVVADVTRDDTISEMANRLLLQAPDRFVLIALSMGGYVAFEVMRQAPERVTALALFDTTATPDSPTRRAEREASIRSLSAGRFAGVTDRLLPQLVDERHVSGEVGGELKAMAARV